MNRYIFPLVFASLLPGALSAQELNSEITVTHQVVPEEQAATRLRLLPSVELPKVTPGRLPMAASATQAPLSPFIMTLEPAPWATTLPRTQQRGYASLAYGPLWNLGASAGYRAIDRDSLSLDAFMQFDGFKYYSTYPDHYYPGGVHLRRNSALVGLRTQWITNAGTLSGSVTYDFSNYNFPKYNNRPAFEHKINANRANVNAAWDGTASPAFSYHVGLAYTLLGFGGKGNPTHNLGTVDAGLLWNYSARSHWGLNLSETLMHSTSGANKGVTHIEPFYLLTLKRFTARIAAVVDLKNGNTDYRYSGLVAPKIDLTWRPSSHFTLWGKTDGRLEANSRANLYDIQPYLLPDFEAGYSRIFTADAGLTIGPWVGASISFFGGYAWTNNWYIPDILPGTMHGVNVCGAHWGGELAYDYRKYLSLKVRAEMAQSPVGEYTTGYALWGDHAKFQLTATAAIRPIDPLEIDLSYKLRTSRNKITADGYQDLLNINQLNASVSYRINPQWTVFINGENLLNKHWYLGPAIPSQGIMGMIGTAYKF